MNELTAYSPPSTALVPAGEQESIERSWALTKAASEQMALVTRKIEERIQQVQQETLALVSATSARVESSLQLIAAAKESERRHEENKIALLGSVEQIGQGTQRYATFCLEAKEIQIRSLDTIAEQKKAELIQQAAEIERLKSAIRSVH